MDNTETPIPELVAAYLRHCRTQAKADFWAWDETKKRVLWSDNPEGAWVLVTALVDAADEDTLGCIAAGPLEDLVSAHGVALVDRLEQAATKPKFKECLGRIWLSVGELPPGVLSRVVAASGGRIKPLPPLEDEA